MEAAMYITLKLKVYFGVIGKCKEVCSRPYLRRVNQGGHCTRSLHLIRTVKTIVCGYTVSQGPAESRQKESDQTVIVYAVSLVVIKFKEMSRRDNAQYKTKYNVYMYEEKYEKLNNNDSF